MRGTRSIPFWSVTLLAVSMIAVQPIVAQAGPSSSTGERLSIVAGVPSVWWTEVRDSLSQRPPADWTAESDQDYASFGFSVGTAGDVNGDGYDDVIVGAPYYDNGNADEGSAFVYHGSASGLSTTPDWTAESNRAFTNFGHSVGTAGDVNGDGFDDVVVGAPYADHFQGDEGVAYVYHGSASGLSTSADWTAESDQRSALFGWSVGTAGDVNGDGFDDLVVGALYYDNGQTDEGRAFAYHGSALGLSTAADWTAEGDQTSAYFGNSVGTAGDVNGDGYADVIVGSFGYRPVYSGAAFAFHGSALGLATTPDWTARGDHKNAYFGQSVGTARDVNGDGFADVIVGAPNYDDGPRFEGWAFAYHGSAAGLSTVANWTAESDQRSGSFGWSVGTAGDMNGDGFQDVIVGVLYYDNGQTDEGGAFAYHGSALGLSTTADWTAESDEVLTNFGYSVGSAGDVNGDGFDDVIVGAPYFDNNQADEGWAFVYHGIA
jgi:hypothetical protein